MGKLPNLTLRRNIMGIVSGITEMRDSIFV